MHRAWAQGVRSDESPSHYWNADSSREVEAAVGAVEIVEEAEDTSIGLQAIEDFDPDVAVIDLEKPLRFSTEAVGRMLLQKPTLRIIALSMYSDRRYLEECLQAGVCGYLLKDCAYEELIGAVSSVTSDRQFVSSSFPVHSA